jgi:hypothetical protein
MSANGGMFRQKLAPVCNMCTIEGLDADIAPGGAGCSFTEAEGCINRITNPTESTRFMMCYSFSTLWADLLPWMYLIYSPGA